METDGFFKWVWRFNALAIAGVACIGGLLGLAGLYFLAQDLTRDRYVANLVNVEPAAERSSEERLGAFSALGRTGLLWAPISRETESELRLSAKYAQGVTDYLIYEPEAGRARALLGLERSLVLQARLLYPPDSDENRAAALALLVAYVDGDTNGDDRLNAEDERWIALARPDGTGLEKLARTPREHGLTVISGAEAVVMVETEDGVEALHLDLAARAISRRVPIER